MLNLLVNLALIATLLLAGCATTGSRATKVTAVASDQIMGRFRALEGDWDVDMNGDGKADFRNRYSVTASGSAVMEQSFVGQDHEMISMIHLDGKRLMLTHYCAARNQPRMVAIQIEEDSVGFDFQDITNLNDPKGLFMHDVRFRFVDANHLETIWTSHENGKAAPPMTFRMTRRK